MIEPLNLQSSSIADLGGFDVESLGRIKTIKKKQARWLKNGVRPVVFGPVFKGHSKTRKNGRKRLLGGVDDLREEI